jgi:hypothetical protein
MSGDVSDRKRLISITGGNLRNKHLYISGHHDFFPDQCYGESSATKGTGHQLKLVVEGLPKPVETDIAKNGGNGRPRNFFRKRAWVGSFFKKHDLREVGVIILEGSGLFACRI